jgi:hypothetical protein
MRSNLCCTACSSAAKAFLPKRLRDVFATYLPVPVPAASCSRHEQHISQIASQPFRCCIRPGNQPSRKRAATALPHTTLKGETPIRPCQDLRPGHRFAALSRSELLLGPHSHTQAFETRTRPKCAPPCQGGSLSASRVSHVHHHLGHVGNRRSYLRTACCMSGPPGPAYFPPPRWADISGYENRSSPYRPTSSLSPLPASALESISASSPRRLTGKHLGKFQMDYFPCAFLRLSFSPLAELPRDAEPGRWPGLDCHQSKTPRSS